MANCFMEVVIQKGLKNNSQMVLVQFIKKHNQLIQD